jgi:hypothetical protein
MAAFCSVLSIDYLLTRATQGVAYAPEWDVVCGSMEDKAWGEVEHGED